MSGPGPLRPGWPYPGADRAAPAEVEPARAAEAGRRGQLDRLADFRAGHGDGGQYRRNV